MLARVQCALRIFVDSFELGGLLPCAQGRTNGLGRANPDDEPAWGKIFLICEGHNAVGKRLLGRTLSSLRGIGSGLDAIVDELVAALGPYDVAGDFANFGDSSQYWRPGLSVYRVNSPGVAKKMNTDHRVVQRVQEMQLVHHADTGGHHVHVVPARKPGVVLWDYLRKAHWSAQGIDLWRRAAQYCL